MPLPHDAVAAIDSCEARRRPARPGPGLSKAAPPAQRGGAAGAGERPVNIWGCASVCAISRNDSRFETVLTLMSRLL